MKLLKSLFLSFLALFTLLGSNALAYDPIVRDFISVRALGMGNVRYTTGLYDENFFANPARATDNPDNQFQLPKITLQAGSATVGTASSLLRSGSNGLSAFKDDVGKPLSLGAQVVFPAYYNNAFITDNWALAIGVIYSAQAVPLVSQSGVVDTTTLTQAGPAFTLARRFLDEHRLSVGVTGHAEFRASSAPNYSVQQFIGGTQVSDALKGGSGIGYDFDVGTTFKPHWTLLGLDYQLAFAVNNVLNGQYNNLSNKPLTGWLGDPLQTHRAWNVGISASKNELLFFDSVVFAVESTDNGNNIDGSFYRTLHAGTEAVWSVFALRLGINQGYFAGGFGIDLGLLDLNIATYGEELGLNAGTFQDRRYAVELGFQL